MDDSLNIKEHWNTAYNKDDDQLGWFESNPDKTMGLIAKTNLAKNTLILNVGAGTTTLIESLLYAGFTNIIANDLSDVALQRLKVRIKKSDNYDLKCVADDLTNPKELNQLKNVDLWIDRAVLHFFLKDEDQETYFNLIHKIIAKNGYVLIAVFAENGGKKCSGLPLQLYSVEKLQDKLGRNFKLIESFNYTFINPSGGERPYIYTLFQKNNESVVVY